MARKTLDWVVLVLLLLGGLNYGLVSFLGFDLFALLSLDWLIKLVHALVALSALWMAYGLTKE